MQHIVAEFRGENGSSEFVKGKRYELFIVNNHIRNMDSGQWIPYGSIEAFFRNWIVTGTRT